MIEAIVSLVVFGIGLLSLLQLAPRASSYGVQARRVSEAMNFAQGKLEELKALPLNDAALDAGTHVDTADLGNFQRRWTVTDDTPMAGMREVTVRVRYSTQSADSVAVLTTYF